MCLQVAQEVKEKLSRVVQKALTTDRWMSRATARYITISSSHINDEWKRGKLCVETHSMDESHTAENICETLYTTVEEWKLPTKTWAASCGLRQCSKYGEGHSFV